MPHYRIQVGNRECVVQNDMTLAEMGEAYGERLMGECSQYGQLTVPYVVPDVLPMLEEAKSTFTAGTQATWLDSPGLDEDASAWESVAPQADNFFTTVANFATRQAVIKNLSPEGQVMAAKLIMEEVGFNGFERLQYADWIMDHGGSRVGDLIDAMRSPGCIPRDAPDEITLPQMYRLREFISTLHAVLIEHDAPKHLIRTPRDNAPSAYELYKQHNPNATVDEFLATMHGPTSEMSTTLDPNGPDSFEIATDPETQLKQLRSVVLTALDDWKRNVDAYHGYYQHLGEARINLLERQFKHIRRYAKTIIKRVTGYGDDFELVHLDVAAKEHFGFVTKDRHSDLHTRHFTIKFVDNNWIITEG